MQRTRVLPHSAYLQWLVSAPWIPKSAALHWGAGCTPQKSYNTPPAETGSTLNSAGVCRSVWVCLYFACRHSIDAIGLCVCVCVCVSVCCNSRQVKWCRPNLEYRFLHVRNSERVRILIIYVTNNLYLCLFLLLLSMCFYITYRSPLVLVQFPWLGHSDLFPQKCLPKCWQCVDHEASWGGAKNRIMKQTN